MPPVFTFVCVFTLLQLPAVVITVPALTHVELCFEVCDCLISWLRLSPKEYALTSVASGATNNAKAAATAVNDKIDFVFIVVCLSVKGNINFILTLNPKTTQKRFFSKFNKQLEKKELIQ